LLLLPACRDTATPAAETAVLQTVPAATDAPAPSAAAPTATRPARPAATPTAVPTNVPTRTPAPTPDPIFPYTIAGLRARAYPGGEIIVGNLLEENNAFRRYAITYPSDGLTISGQMHLPTGAGPFPVVILLHGYWPREQYHAGTDTQQAAEFLARQGYLAIAPDLRSWGASDSGPSLFHTGLVADTINLISALPSLPEADAERLGLWGHSMGGGIATKVLAVDQRVDAAVLVAPNSADDADLIGRWGPGCLAGQSEAAGDRCNPAELLPPDLPPELLRAYFAAAADPDALRRIAPLYHLQGISAPVQVHIGTGDGAALEQTPPDWSAKLAEALQAEGKAVEYFSYPGQGHFFQGRAWEQLLARGVELFAGALGK